MEDIRSVYLTHLEGRLREIACQLTRARFTSSQVTASWHPAINAYRCQDCILIVAELAGVDRSMIALTAESRRIWLRGRRLPPEPGDSEGPPQQILAMEIDDGTFEREIALPVAVDADQVHAEQREGLLWIRLPLAQEL